METQEMIGRGRPWVRAFGDVVELGLLGWALKDGRANRRRLAIAGAAVLGLTTFDVLAARWRRGADARDRGAISVTRATTIHRSPEEVYRFWRAFENLPRVLTHLESVTVDGLRSHWRAKTPNGRTIEGDARIVKDRPNELVSWESDDASVRCSGSTRFRPAPGGRGTEVIVELSYGSGGVFAAAVAKVRRLQLDRALAESLGRLKQILETGEVVRSEAKQEAVR